MPPAHFLCRDTLTTQLQLLHTKADSEALARGIAEDQLSDVEKERTMLQLEVKEVLSRHNHDLTMKDSLLALVSDMIFFCFCVFRIEHCMLSFSM